MSILSDLDDEPNLTLATHKAEKKCLYTITQLLYHVPKRLQTLVNTGENFGTRVCDICANFILTTETRVLPKGSIRVEGVRHRSRVLARTHRCAEVGLTITPTSVTGSSCHYLTMAT